MISQNVFYASAPIESSGNLLLSGSGFALEFSANKLSSQTGQITGLISATVTAQTGDFYRIENQSQFSNSGVFNYLGPTGRFFPPLLTFQMRTGIFSGYSSPADSPYDGMICFQYGASGQKFMAVQSGMWKVINLS